MTGASGGSIFGKMMRLPVFTPSDLRPISRCMMWQLIIRITCPAV